jgi:hypothetical protein
MLTSFNEFVRMSKHNLLTTSIVCTTIWEIYLWWRSIEANPTNPWVDQDGNPNPFHGRKSFGIYDALSIGKGDYYELIVNGRKQNLVVSNDLFPELAEDEPTPD